MVDSQASPPLSGAAINVDVLQQEVISLLGQINQLIDNTQADLSSISDVKYDQFQAQIVAASENVASLELRMAIVAPMKAGKSTIINAISGQELLPSCAMAMTTIPTEISFQRNITVPKLQLSSSTLELFQELEQNLKQRVEQWGLKALQQKLSRYPHLQDLFAEIASRENFPVQAETEGATAIAKTLEHLNHLIRLYSVIEPEQDPLARLIDIPCIVTPSLRLGSKEQRENWGKLTIIDTPGPNEAEEGLKLTAVVAEQLRRSSVVLVVLDFTQFNSEAAAKIKQQIQPIIQTIGKDNLYVLVNKVDQRRPGDMTPEQVKEFVIADLELNSQQDQERIFETAAIRAFAATKFILEVQQNPRIKLLEIKSLTTLAQEVLGIDWDEELEDITVKILAKKAHKLWHKSGFASFISQAIASLTVNAAPQCLSNALSLSKNHLISLRDDLKLRHNAITQDTAQIQSEIQALEQDLAYLESCRERLSSIADIKISLQQSLQTLLTDLKQSATVDVENFFVEEEYVQGDVLKKADINTRNLLLSNLGDFELFPKWVSENLKAGIEYKISGIVSFKTEAEAEYFTQETISRAKHRLEELILQVSHDIEQEVKVARQNLEEFLIKETADVIARAKERLETVFEVQLNLPTPIITNEQKISVEGQLVKTKSRLVDDGYEEKLVKKRAWYYWFGIIPFYKQEKYKKPYKKEDYFAVSVHEIVKEINTSTDIFIDEIQLKVTHYLEQELHQQVDHFFIELDKYLNNYLQSLQQAQSDHKLSLAQRDTLSNNLSRLVPKTTNYLNQANNYWEQTQQLLVHNSSAHQ